MADSLSKKLSIAKDNALVGAHFKLDPGENRLIHACIAQIGKGEKITDSKMYVVKATDFAEMAGISRQAAYKELKLASKKLFDRSIYVPHDSDGKKPETHRFRWIQEEAVYDQGGGYVSIRFSKAVIPYISALERRFTVYQLSDISRMTSSYAPRLYEILMRWDDVGSKTLSIEWIREAFVLEGKYKKMKDFKANVIEPAVKQINQHTPMKLSWTQEKTGRSITHINFTFSFPAKILSDVKASSKGSGIPKALLDRFRQPGDSDEKAAQRVRAARQAAEG